MSSILIEIPCLANEIKRNVGDRNILFQDRPVATPFTVAMTENEGIVRQVTRVID